MHVETIERLRQTKLLSVEENEGGRRDYRGLRCGALIDYGEVNFQSLGYWESGAQNATYEAKTTSRLLGDMDLFTHIRPVTNVLALSQTNEWKLARTHIEPTGASTLIDMFKLNVGEPYAEEVSPFDREAFGEFMMIVAQ